MSENLIWCGCHFWVIDDGEPTDGPTIFLQTGAQTCGSGRDVRLWRPHGSQGWRRFDRRLRRLPGI
jgi:hypothetical protein